MRNPNDSTPAHRRNSHNELRKPHDRLNLPTVNVDGRPMTIGALIHDVARLRRHAFDEQAKPMNLTRSQYSVLAHLGRNPDRGMNQSEIAAALEVGKVTLGGLVDRLEASGLARRELCGEDRRIKRIRLTSKGRRALETAQRMRPMLDEFILQDLPESTRSELAGALAAMRANLLKMQRDRRPQSVGLSDAVGANSRRGRDA